MRKIKALKTYFNIKTELLNSKTRSISMARCIYVIICAVSMMMTVVNFFTKKYELMGYTLGFGILCIVNFFISLKGEKCANLSKLLFQVELCFLCMYFVISGNPDGFSTLWILLVPGCSFLLFERGNASVLCLSGFLMLVFFFYTPVGRMSLIYTYNDTFMMRFPLLYLAFASVSMFLAYCIEIYQKRLKEIQEGLEEEVKKRTKELVTQKMELEKLKSEAMISQIQPHFIYNTISAIAAIPGNCDETVDALVDFGKYLRVNLDALSDGKTIPIDSEIEHVKRYVNLEKLRFEDKIKIDMKIHDHDFYVPPLSVQMLVENAIKHGLQPRRREGSVRILTERINNEHVITVNDDGVGFQVGKNKAADTIHIGLKNIEERVSKMCGGRLEIESEKEKGTEVRIYIPEWRENHEDNSC